MDIKTDDEKTRSREFYQLRKNGGNGRSKEPRVTIIQGTPSEINKLSGQIKDPFTESSGFRDYYPTPYNFSTLLNFYYDNTWHGVCVRIKKQATVGGFKIVGIEQDQKPDGEYQRLVDFLDQINVDFEDLIEVLGRVMIDLEAIGNAYIEIVRNALGQVVEIYHIPAHTVRKHSTKNGYVQIRLKMGVGGVSETVYFRRYSDETDPARSDRKVHEIIHLKEYFPASKYYGLPDFMAALGAITMDRSAVIFNNNYFENGGMFGLILWLKNAALNTTMKSALRSLLTNNFTGIDNAHRMALVDELPENAELHVEKLMEQVKDMSFERLRKFNRDEILAAHLVPPKMVYVATPGQLGESNDSYNQMKFFKLIEIDPAQARIERILNRIIKNDLGIQRWRIKFNELDVRSPKDISEEIWGDVEHGIRSTDEGRSMRGLDEAEVTKRMDRLISNLNKIEKAVINL